MKAAVCREFGAPLVIEEVAIADAGAGQIRVRVAACAVCHSDIYSMQGAWGGTLPAVYGHEAAGVVESVGPQVTRFRPGDRVVVTLLRSCGACFFCARENPFLCEAAFPAGESGPLRAADGTAIEQGLNCGAFAEQVVVDASQAVALPDDIALDVAALLGCGVITGTGAVFNTAAVEPGSHVVVIGAGGVGLNCIQAAHIAGARSITAIDPSATKRAAALSFRATQSVDPAQGDVRAAIDAVTEGRGADHVFVAVGAKPAIEQGLTLMRRGGQVTIVGMPASGVTAAFDPGWLAGDGQRIVGSNMGSSRIDVDIPRLIGLYREGRLELDRLISGRYPLAEINEAVASVLRGEALRNLIILDSGALAS
jgi:Zn-dependent alcohol dehydrogenase